MYRHASHHQLAFGLTVSGILMVLGLLLQSLGEDGFASLLTGGLLMILNMAQYLRSQNHDRSISMTPVRIPAPDQGGDK